MRKYQLVILLLVVMCLVSTGCLRIYTVARDKYDDDFVVHKINPRTTLFGEEKKLKLYLSPQVITEPDKEDAFSITVIQRTRHEDLIIKTMKGATLEITTDSESAMLETIDGIYGETGIKSHEFPLWRHRINDISGYIIEKTSYGATFELIQKIADAQKVEVTLKGEGDRSVKKKFLEQHFAIFKRFVKYAKKEIGA